MTDPELWLLRALWLVLPFSAGPVFEAALDDASGPVRVGASLGLWVAWGLMLIALMVPRTETLTALRVTAPAALVLVVWALLDAGGDIAAWRAVLGGTATAVTAALAMRASIADRFVDGSSYGDERRFLLRTPGPLLVGPLIVVWAVTLASALAGPLLLLAERWILGPILTAVGIPLAWFGVQAIHRLSQRWLVFVPAGLVVHDRTALREPQLFSTRDIAAFGPAPSDTEYEDLSLDAPGLALRVELRGPSKIIRNARGKAIDLTDIDGFVVMPNRPGAVIEEAERRGLPIA